MTDNIITLQDPEESLMTFPNDFPLKVMGKNQEGFLEAIAELVQQHDSSFEAHTIEKNHSRDGNYVSLRIRVMATDQEQLDNIYRALTSHPMVKVVF